MPPQARSKVTAISVMLLVFLMCGCFKDDRQAVEQQISFSLSTVDDQLVNSSDLQGKVVLLDFWASWCGPCRYCMPKIKELHYKFKDKGLVVIAVNHGEASYKAKKYAEDNKVPFLMAYGGEELERQLGGIFSLPTFVLLDKSGRLYSRQSGCSEDLALQLELKIMKLLGNSYRDNTGERFFAPTYAESFAFSGTAGRAFPWDRRAPARQAALQVSKGHDFGHGMPVSRHIKKCLSCRT